jgi:hypothetical protein
MPDSAQGISTPETAPPCTTIQYSFRDYLKEEDKVFTHDLLCKVLAPLFSEAVVSHGGSATPNISNYKRKNRAPRRFSSDGIKQQFDNCILKPQGLNEQLTIDGSVKLVGGPEGGPHPIEEFDDMFPANFTYFITAQKLCKHQESAPEYHESAIIMTGVDWVAYFSIMRPDWRKLASAVTDNETVASEHFQPLLDLYKTVIRPFSAQCSSSCKSAMQSSCYSPSLEPFSRNTIRYTPLTPPTTAVSRPSLNTTTSKASFLERIFGGMSLRKTRTPITRRTAKRRYEREGM